MGGSSERSRSGVVRSDARAGPPAFGDDGDAIIGRVRVPGVVLLASSAVGGGREQLVRSRGSKNDRLGPRGAESGRRPTRPSVFFLCVFYPMWVRADWSDATSAVRALVAGS